MTINNAYSNIGKTNKCGHCEKSFVVTEADLAFYKKISPKFAGKLYEVPAPSLCPDCRQQRRLSFRNERRLYKRLCDATKQPIISIYSEDKPYKVFDQKVRWSDMRDPMEYGRDFDFSRSFTQQFGELMLQVPRCSILNINSENSDYTNICANNKNCYMLVESSNNENCYHGYWLQKTQTSLDCAMLNSCQQCYESADLDTCYKLFYSRFCFQCSNSYFIENCSNCEYCFACIGLESKKYHVFNEPLTKDEFEKQVSAYNAGSNEYKLAIRQRFEELRTKYGAYGHIRNSSNCSGDYIYDASDIVDSSEIRDANNVSYSRHVWFHSGDSMDVDTVGYNSFLMYECINTALDAYNNKFCMRCRSGCNNCLYCDNCDSISYCFGCIGLRNKQYCIFNKQYTKEEYEEIVGKIIGHMQTTCERGEFFYPSLSPFGYNETVAQEYYPEQVTSSQLQVANNRGAKALEIGHWNLAAFGYKRSDYEPQTPQVDKVIKGADLPDTIIGFELDGSNIQAGYNILKVVILCEISNRPFRVIPQELAFYIKHGIPLPRKHPDIRHAIRMENRMKVKVAL